MATDRRADVTWQGSLLEGSGTITATTSGAIGEQHVSWPARSEDATGGKTSPEELIAAAHAGCFTMALSASLGRAGFTPKRLATQAAVTLEQVSGNWTISKVELETEAWIPQITPEKFQEIAADAKANCPVSRLLRAEITLHAKLEHIG